MPDDSDQGGQDESNLDRNVEEHIEGDGDDEEQECHDDEVGDVKDHYEVDRDGEEQFEGGGNGKNSTASDSDSASNVQATNRNAKQ